MGRKNSKKKKQKLRQRPARGKTYEGILDVTRSGVGFVRVKDIDIDIFVRAADFKTALNGDKVRVRVEVEKRGRRMQGIITEVLDRKQNEFIGRIEMNEGFAFFIPEKDKSMPDIYISLNNINGAKNEDHVVVRIL